MEVSFEDKIYANKSEKSEMVTVLNLLYSGNR
jgi:hypothetical protein